MVREWQAGEGADEGGLPASAARIGLLVEELRQGKPGALEALVPLLYDDLRLIAHRQLRRHRPGQTLDTTALVNEAYLQLAGRPHSPWSDRRHFLAVAAVAMRHIVVDYARRRGAQKRGGGLQQTELDDERMGLDPRSEDLLMLDGALVRLAELDPRLAHLVELRYFVGLTLEETAETLEISSASVKRDWAKARVLLLRLCEEPPVAG